MKNFCLQKNLKNFFQRKMKKNFFFCFGGMLTKYLSLATLIQT
jgi:hypothetical protein